MLEKFFRRGGIENSKKSPNEEIELDKMAGEIHSADFDKRQYKDSKAAEVYFKDLGFLNGDKVVVRRDDGSGYEGVILKFESDSYLTPDPEKNFLAAVFRVDGGNIYIQPKDIRAGRVKKL